jgi:hypothetical protein
MTDIVVHRCELRIRRTSGWAWGASPDDLIKAATRAIPQLLAARLPQLAVTDGETVAIDRPIMVKIAATARQLAALADGTPGPPDVAALRVRIEVAVAGAVAQALARGGAIVATPVEAKHVDADAAADEDEAARAAELANDEAPRRAARVWWRAGAIDAVLARLEPRALARLHELLLGDDASAAATEVSSELVAVVARIAASFCTVPATTLERVRRRIALAAGTIDAAPAATPAQLRAAIDQIAPLADGSSADLAASAQAELEDAPAGRQVGRSTVYEVPTEAAPGAASGRAATHVGELEIRSALPFLLLAPLRRAGWLDAAATLLALHQRQADAFALAAGLAAKVLDPLERGWARSPADRIAIAVFAGRPQPIADAEIADAAARLCPLLGPLDAGLRAMIARVRRPAPLVLWHDDRGWLLVDTDDTAVLAANPLLRDVLAVAPPAPIIVPARFADSATFDQIDYANARFITDAAPSRGETWRSFAGTTRRLYTNDTSTPAGKLVAATAHLDHSLALVEELAEALSERPAIPGDPPTAFEVTCTLAATSALADLSERLFPAEPTTPVLALARFRDLDARVWFEQDRIRVRVPLGRRHADLMHHAVLGTFADVPWLAGRTLDLGGG